MSTGNNNLAAEVQSLNKRIEAINAERTKAETRKAIFESQLNEALAEYSSKYGVDLGIGKSFSEIVSAVQDEAKSVGAEISKELALKSRVVTAIESGDFDTAYGLLGMEAPEVVKCSVEAVVEENNKQHDSAENMANVENGAENETEVSGTMLSEPANDDGFIEEPVSGGFDLSGVDLSGLAPDDDDAPEKQPVSGSKAADAVKDVEVAGFNPNDWGFGDMLSGTAFGGNKQ